MENMSEEIIVEDYMLEEIETWKYYLSKEEFEDTILHLEDHKPKYITVGKPIQFVTINRRQVFDYNTRNNFNEYDGVAGTSSTCEESLDLCKRKKQLALQGIEEYYDRRGLKRKLGFAGIGNDEERRQRKKTTVIEDCGNLDILADACCSIDNNLKPKLVIRLKVNSPTAAENRSKVKSRKRVKVKKMKKSSDNRMIDEVAVANAALPAEYIERINKLNGRDIRLIEEKALTFSDINPGLCRLLLNQKDFVVKPEFLRDDEEKKIANKDGYIIAKLVEPMGCYQEIKVNKWSMNQNRYNTLLKPWKAVANSNGFGVDDVVQVWAFRFDDNQLPDKLGVAVVRIYTAPRENSPTTGGSSGDGNCSSSLCSS